MHTEKWLKTKTFSNFILNAPQEPLFSIFLKKEAAVFSLFLFFFFFLTSLTELSAQLFFITYLKDFLEKPQPNYFVSLTSDILIDFPS